MKNKQNLKFYKFSIFLKTSLIITDLSLPGIFVVKCNLNQKIFFSHDDSILFGIDRFFDSLVKNEIKNQNLLQDYEKYGESGFSYYVFDASYDLDNPIYREKK